MRGVNSTPSCSPACSGNNWFRLLPGLITVRTFLKLFLPISKKKLDFVCTLCYNYTCKENQIYTKVEVVPVYRIKKTCYYADPNVKPYNEYMAAMFADREFAILAAMRCAKKECKSLNAGGNRYGNFFEVNDYSGSFDVSVDWYDHAPKDRINDCDIRTVTGYTVCLA